MCSYGHIGRMREIISLFLSLSTLCPSLFPISLSPFLSRSLTLSLPLYFQRAISFSLFPVTSLSLVLSLSCGGVHPSSSVSGPSRLFPCPVQSITFYSLPFQTSRFKSSAAQRSPHSLSAKIVKGEERCELFPPLFPLLGLLTLCPGMFGLGIVSDNPFFGSPTTDDLLFFMGSKS